MRQNFWNSEKKIIHSNILKKLIACNQKPVKQLLGLEGNYFFTQGQVGLGGLNCILYSLRLSLFNTWFDFLKHRSMTNMQK